MIRYYLLGIILIIMGSCSQPSMIVEEYEFETDTFSKDVCSLQENLTFIGAIQD